MENWKERVEQERAELLEKIAKLRDFKAYAGTCFDALSQEQRNLLRMQRVEQERAELFEKIAKLRDFKASAGFDALSQEQRNLLRMQMDVMCEYHNILWRRTLE